ncbi:MAG: amidohydrolase [Synergistaceae bacterium]|jgi:amidohydrolase|nr:amidohydrolase [Synergistaceae bacterium]
MSARAESGYIGGEAMILGDWVMYLNEGYITDIRRRIHARPEIGFDLPETVALVKSELGAMGIPFTERYGRSSIVAEINGGKKAFTAGIRADMDALPIEEANDVPYRSTIKNAMHACGHDAHTAILLGTARVLKSIEDRLECRVRLLFQPCEEGEESGARLMTENGVMDDIDVILGLHVDNRLESGHIGVCPGESMAASHPIKIEFFGKSTHATTPHTGRDALAMAVKTYSGIQAMLCREIDPFARYACSVCSLNSGLTYNVVPDRAEMKIALRTFDAGLDNFIADRIRVIAGHAASEMGGRASVTGETEARVVFNDPALSELVLKSAAEALGPDRTSNISPRLGSEDFSFYLAKKPGVFLRLGTRNEKKGCVAMPHSSDFMIDEDALASGVKVFVQFVVDNMRGIDLPKRA